MSETMGLNWGVERRLEFIEFRLLWEGGVNRADIERTFGVSTPQASKDLTLYQERAPGNAVYDKSAKRYVAGPEFSPIFIRANPDEYLGRLRARAEGLADAESSWVSGLPTTDVALTPHREVDAAVLRSILAAVRASQSVEVLYQSMGKNREAPEWRTITPHALASDGFRWHVRGFCHKDKIFKDFLLPRILETGKLGVAGATAMQDDLWQSSFELAIGPHPGLGIEQQAAVEKDYGMKDHQAALKMRKAMLLYVVKRLGLLDDALNADPHRQHIIDLNRAATKAELAAQGIVVE